MKLNIKVIDLPVLLPESNGCELCIERLREKLSALRGVVELAIEKNSNKMEIKYDPNFISLEKIKFLIKRCFLSKRNF